MRRDYGQGGSGPLTESLPGSVLGYCEIRQVATDVQDFIT